MRKRANGEGSMRKRSNGTWEGRITVGTDPMTGKSISKSVYGRTQKEVREKMKALQAGGQQAGGPSAAGPSPVGEAADTPKEMTVGEWLDMWLKEYLADVKPGTYINYESVTRLFLKPVFGEVPLSRLRTPMIQRFYNHLRDENRSPKYIKNIHGIFHRALDMAVRVEYLQRNPSSACVLPRVVEKPVTPMDIPEQKRFFKALKDSPFEALFLTAVFTGMRVGEIIGLTWDCVDFEHGVIHVEKQLVQTRVKGQRYVFGTLKNGKTRIITPAPFLLEVLRAHQAAQQQQKRAAGDLWDEGDFPNLVFTHADGSHYSQPTIWKELQDILEAAGLEHHRVHDLRHTFAVNSIIAGDDIKTLQENMGHYSAAFTLDRYGHVTDTMRRESANRMQAFIEKMA